MARGRAKRQVTQRSRRNDRLHNKASAQGQASPEAGEETSFRAGSISTASSVLGINDQSTIPPHEDEGSPHTSPISQSSMPLSGDFDFGLEGETQAVGKDAPILFQSDGDEPAEDDVELAEDDKVYDIHVSSEHSDDFTIANLVDTKGKAGKTPHRGMASSQQKGKQIAKTQPKARTKGKQPIKETPIASAAKAQNDIPKSRNARKPKPPFFGTSAPRALDHTGPSTSTIGKSISPSKKRQPADMAKTNAKKARRETQQHGNSDDDDNNMVLSSKTPARNAAFLAAANLNASKSLKAPEASTPAHGVGRNISAAARASIKTPLSQLPTKAVTSLAPVQASGSSQPAHVPPRSAQDPIIVSDHEVSNSSGSDYSGPVHGVSSPNNLENIVESGPPVDDDPATATGIVENEDPLPVRSIHNVGHDGMTEKAHDFEIPTVELSNCDKTVEGPSPPRDIRRSRIGESGSPLAGQWSAERLNQEGPPYLRAPATELAQPRVARPESNTARTEKHAQRSQDHVDSQALESKEANHGQDPSAQNGPLLGLRSISNHVGAERPFHQRSQEQSDSWEHNSKGAENRRDPSTEPRQPLSLRPNSSAARAERPSQRCQQQDDFQWFKSKGEEYGRGAPTQVGLPFAFQPASLEWADKLAEKRERNRAQARERRDHNVRQNQRVLATIFETPNSLDQENAGTGQTFTHKTEHHSSNRPDFHEEVYRSIDEMVRGSLVHLERQEKTLDRIVDSYAKNGAKLVQKVLRRQDVELHQAALGYEEYCDGLAKLYGDSAVKFDAVYKAAVEEEKMQTVKWEKWNKEEDEKVAKVKSMVAALFDD